MTLTTEDNHPGANNDPLARYKTRRASDVVSNLLDLSRSVEPLTILFEGGKHSFPTTVIDLIEDNSLVVIERAGSDVMNKKLIECGKGTVIGQPEGIKLRFVLEQIEARTLDGEKVFVAPLPKEHYRMQRRQMFRIETLIRSPVIITIPQDEESPITLRAGNISSGGLRLDDIDHLLDVEPIQRLEHCVMQLPDVDSFEVTLEVRNTYDKVKARGQSVHYVGCSFIGLNADEERTLQNYINHLQLAQRALAK